MEIPIAPEIEAVVLRKVALGEYRTVAELVEEALFLLVERDFRAAQAVLAASGAIAVPGKDDPR